MEALIEKGDLPDCVFCGCLAVNHVIPPENTSMLSKCYSCSVCPGYAAVDPERKSA